LGIEIVWQKLENGQGRAERGILKREMKNWTLGRG
jgi:hypothetical protein